MSNTYEVPVTFPMGERKGLPPLKRLHKVAEERTLRLEKFLPQDIQVDFVVNQTGPGGGVEITIRVSHDDVAFCDMKTDMDGLAAMTGRPKAQLKQQLESGHAAISDRNA